MTIAATTPSGSLPHPVILWIAQLRAWVFLIVLVLFFEIWARAAEGISFLFNVYNIQSILVFATAPLLLALGQTFVIISVRHRPVARLRDGPVVGDRGARLQLLHGAARVCRRSSAMLLAILSGHRGRASFPASSTAC